jgi:sporulation-control protein spo0M
MGIFNQKLMTKISAEAEKQITKNMLALENQMITIQKNQCEQEAYHKKTIALLEEIKKQVLKNG